MFKGRVGLGVSKSRVGVFSPNIVSSVQYNLGGRVKPAGILSYFSSFVFLNLYSYQGYLGCALPLSSVYSLGKRLLVFNILFHAMGVRSGVGGVLLPNDGSVRNSIGHQIPLCN